MKPYCVTIQMKATKQSFHLVLFVMLVVSDQLPLFIGMVSDHSNEIYEQRFHMVLYINVLLAGSKH